MSEPPELDPHLAAALRAGGLNLTRVVTNGHGPEQQMIFGE